MQTSDIDLGLYWPPTKTFYKVGDIIPAGGGEPAYQVEESDSNAMRVTGYRVATRSNALPLFFARIFGRTQIDVTATATAYVRAGPTGGEFGIVGLTGIDSNGTHARIDSYVPPNVTVFRENARVASNDDIDLGNGDVYGDARPGVNKHMFQGPTSIVTGYTAPLTEPLVYPPVTVPGGAIPLGNFSGSTLAAGNYTANKFEPADNFTVTGGVVSVYVSGDIKLTGNQNVNNSGLASNFRIYGVGNPKIDTVGVSSIRCWIYSPDSVMVMKGTTDFFGAIVAKSIAFQGNGAIHYDESHGGGTGETPFNVVLIK